MPAKFKVVNNQKGIVPLSFFLIAVVAVLAALVVGKNSIQKSSPEPQNEDELSMTQVPEDVLAALNKAKSSGEPVLGIRADGPSYHIPILMYHYVEHVKDQNDKLRIALNTPPELLDQQINTLKQAGYTFLTASDFANILDNIENLPPKPVMLTFDDGYSDFYSGAFPILKKYQVKATAYVISGFLNSSNYLTDGELQEIAKSGLVEIGAHTIHHLALAGINKAKAETEISSSKIGLEQKLGAPVTAFAYPYGSFDLNSIQMTKQAGYRSAVSTIAGSNTSNSVRFFANRLRPGGRSGQSLLDLVK